MTQVKTSNKAGPTAEARASKKIRSKKGIPPMILFLMVTFSLIVIASLLAPVLFPIDLAATDLGSRLAKPRFLDSSSPYLFGTDNLGRDVAVRLLYATRSTITIAFSGMVIAAAAGTILGVVGGLKGGWWDLVITFLTDARLSIPTTFIGIICACILGASEKTIVMVIAITGWSSFTRLVRSQVLQLKNADFIESSRSLGASNTRILLEHILINISSPLIVEATLSLSSFVLLESTLSYLGLGIQPPNTSLGLMVSNGRDFMLNNWWLAIIPSIVIVIIILQISLIGDWLRDKLDPKLQNNR